MTLEEMTDARDQVVVALKTGGVDDVEALPFERGEKPEIIFTGSSGDSMMLVLSVA